MSEINSAAYLLGFVDGLLEAGGYEDFRPRQQWLKGAVEEYVNPGHFAAALNRGRALDLERARHLIVDRQELTL